MAHRIEVELTSQTGDSTWTWRAAGAKQPRGTVEASLVPEGSGVGTVLRAEVETTLDGTTVTALLPPKGKGDVRSVERIEVLGTPQRGPDVNVVLASKSKRRRDERPDGPRDGARRPADRRPRSESGDGGGERGQRGDPCARGGDGIRRPRPRTADPEADRPGPTRRSGVGWTGQSAPADPVEHLPQRCPGHAPSRAAPGGRATPEGRHSRRPSGHRGAEQPGPGREQRPEVTPGPLLAWPSNFSR